MLAVEQHAREHKAEDLTGATRDAEGGEGNVYRLKLHSQMPVVPFYTKLGFRKEGPEFDEEGGESFRLQRG
jgi:predicted GNAT family N-acyltransferase